jgi:hypothetical protein
MYAAQLGKNVFAKTLRHIQCPGGRQLPMHFFNPEK